MTSTATFSLCGRYRFTLVRRWNSCRPVIVFLMLNPSTADASVNDPTVRRCIGFAAKWGYGGVIVLNLFALRSTKPIALYGHPHPIDPRHQPGSNDRTLLRVTEGRKVVCAWGNHGAYQDRAKHVIELLADRDLCCLGYTGKGLAKHPLYLPDATALIPL